MFGGFKSFATFGRDRRGNVAMLWGLMGAGLVGLIGLTVDFTRAQMIHTQLQNAADGAALAAARAPANLSLADRTTAARAFFDAEAGEYAQGASFALVAQGEQGYRVNVNRTMDGSLTRLISQQDWNIGVESQAVRGGVNLEVAMVLDTTGSMSGQRIADLRNSAGELVDIVVSPNQTPYYSKVALVTYAMGVNAGAYAANVRGAIPGPRNVTAAAWTDGTNRSISSATKASPGVFTSSNHGLQNGDVVWVSGIGSAGNWDSNLNNRWFTIANRATNTFQLRNSSGNIVNTNGYSGNYPGSGIVRRCLTAECRVVVTASNHGFADNAWVYITGVNGMTQINSTGDNAWQVDSLTSSTFALIDSTGATYGAYTNGGDAYCTTLGCQYYRFTNANNSTRILQVSTCVSERTGANATTDVAPSAAPLGYNYAPSGNPCDSGTGLIPLTTDTASLHNRINSLGAAGSTAAQTGVAWGWYMLSPNFGYLWPNSTNRPAAYGAPETQKIAVLMTDGAFNSPYCSGVIARDAISGSGSAADHSNCDSPNGSAHAQVLAMCTAMKQAGVIVYTVGFHIGNDANARQAFEQCATNPDTHFFEADNGTELQDAFRRIGQSISQLRLTH